MPISIHKRAILEIAMSRSHLAVVTLILTLNAAAAADEKARAVIDRAIEAHGGETNVEKLSTAQVKVEGKATLPGVGSASTVIQDFWQLPSQYKTIQEYEAMDMKFVQTIVMNDNQMWISVNGQTQSLPKEAQAEMKEQIYAESLDKLSPFLKERYNLSLLDDVTIDGQAAVGVQVSAEGHRDVELYFSKTNGLLVKRRDVMIQQTGEKVTREVYFSKYKEVDGVQHWMSIVGYYDGKKIFEGEVTKLKFPDKFETNVFAKP